MLSHRIISLIFDAKYAMVNAEGDSGAFGGGFPFSSLFKSVTRR